MNFIASLTTPFPIFSTFQACPICQAMHVHHLLGKLLMAEFSVEFVFICWIYYYRSFYYY